MEPVSQDRAPRLLYMDHLRVFLTVLVILHHAAITYGAPGGWYYREDPPNGLAAEVLLTLFVATNQAFFMGFFFFIAGYFTPQAYDRKGAAAFLSDRAKRLGIPLVVYALSIDPAMGYALRASARGAGESPADAFRAVMGGLPRIGVGPLWFVEILLIFSVVYVGVRLLAPYQQGSGTASQTTARVPGFVRLAGCALALGVVSFAVRVRIPVGGSLPFPHIQPPYAAQYIAMFPLGVAAYRRGWLRAVPDRYARAAGWTVAALIVFFFVLFGIGELASTPIGAYMGGWRWQALALALWEQALGVAMIVLLLATFRRRVNEASAIGSRATACAYAAYILHAPVLLGVSLACRGWEAGGLVKFVAVGPAVVAMTFALADVVRRLPGARAVL
ncbi:acyltransferase family protein [Candidatus Poribacteria bacterium]|jgi:glucans biosynthesis protein C|nr:acyltransferase family protein [Candidatus Poribacteria bacterium]MBT5531991.1 acyltransferase family protein [Candidatus Poribacteria bacterium]MBT5713166.1 acyltransferase family protein [Candidatus Poribacteria bacterium]MBT7808620.1 acyltransferase family protein [Candidatus Poribacteria bacterium]